MKKCLVIFIFLFAVKSFAQQNPDIKRTWHWYFGNGAGLDFSTGTAVADTNGNIFSTESSCAISDTSGNLLFYTDGDTVWDRRHMMMPNGYGLYGSCIPPGPQGSAVQGCVIIPSPRSNNMYYIFTVDCGENLGIRGLNYSIVDMNLNSGYGDVTIKNKNLMAPSTEVLTVAKDSSDGYWVITHGLSNNLFYSYHITSSGVDTLPVISASGLIFNDMYGTIKVSPNGKLLSFTCIYGNQIFLFNNSNGTISYYCTLPQAGSGAYSSSFSPDNSKVYYTDSGNMIYVFDLCSEDTTLIQQSIDTIYAAVGNETFTGCQLGPDYALYISSILSNKISKIQYPNSKEGFELLGVDLNGRQSYFGMINIPDFYFNSKSSVCKTYSEIVQTNILIPNIFTPNNDGVNDNFSATISGYRNIEYSIYNRWGEKIISNSFSLSSDKEETIILWDGYIHKSPAPDGTYFYIIQLINKNNETETKKGFFQLLTDVTQK